MPSQSPSGARTTNAYSQAWAAVNRLIREGKSWSGREANCVYVNAGDGTFADASFASGGAFADDARAVAYVDWDEDGDLDLWLANRTAPKVRCLANRAADGSRFLALRLRAPRQRDAIGARVDLRVGDARQVRIVQAGSGYLSQSTKWIHFGLGAAESVDELVVRWPDGTVQKLGKLAAGRYQLAQGGEPRETAPHATPKARELAASTPAALPAKPGARIAASRRVPLPEMAIADAKGTRRSLGGGRPVLVNFWTTSCASCRAELGEWNAERERLEKLGLDVLALSVDERGSAEPAAAMAALNPWFAWGAANDEWILAFDVLQAAISDRKDEMRVPTSFLVDGSRRLAYVYKGKVGAEQLARDVASLSLDDAAFARASVPFAGRWHALSELSSFVDIGGEMFERGALDPARFFVEQGCSGIPTGVDGPWQKRASAALLRLGLGFHDAKRDAEASSLLERAVAFDPGNAVAWLALGDARSKSSRAPDAIAAYRRAVAADSALCEAWLRLGNLLNKSDDLAGGIEAFRGAVSADPADWKGWFALGSSLLASSRPADALPCFRRSSELEPAHALSWTGIGTCLAVANDRPGAIAALEHALQLDPKEQRAASLLASLRSK